MKNPWGDVANYPDHSGCYCVPAEVLLVFGLSYNMYYLGKRLYKWELGPDQRRVPHDMPYYMLSTRSIQLEQDITAAQRGSTATHHLAAFVQLLVHLPPPSKFDSFVEAEDLDRGHDDAPVRQQQHSKRARGGFDFRALDTAVIVGKPEHRQDVSFSLFLIAHKSDYSGHAEDTSKLSIISMRIPVIEEIPAMRRLDIDPASLTLVFFGFSASEIPSYDFGADVVPLQPLIERAISMDCTSTF
ncbi:hypothetical protein JCGZ_18198 [Jatropha curcas]|uniref:Uncharacterized protein n=1 Tax=Jatropha curcas TaxID=180498 RepID=A0A067KD55_JATCU|nr:hypothetical protein JCGZ_18198 [Jatropha curcas]